ncbi:HAD family hydrolase [Roseovarius atlanticus]|uniref:HAD family hydrolase n=1 Tax=Roseovarius atlanticus TaxID=1641875 RepID=UPI0013649E1D|nr:HAD family hydrolase [Roseovarius atlanticus]
MSEPQAKRKQQNPPIVFLDADNTLWDTDRVFADAQLGLLSAVEEACDKTLERTDRLAFVRSIDQELASRHHLGLRYPPRLLIAALAMMLDGMSAKESARKAWAGNVGGVPALAETENANIQQRYFADLTSTPALLPGVANGLSELKKCGATTIVLTEGKKERVVQTAKALGIVRFIDKYVEAKKDRRFFDRMLRFAGSPRLAIMIGDQLTKDILPAARAGLKTIYIPGRFVPSWEEKERKVESDFRLTSFSDVPNAVRRLLSENKLDCDAKILPKAAQV